MARGRWWVVVAGIAGATAVVGGLGVATGCLPVASACVGPVIGVVEPQDTTWSMDTPTHDEVVAGEEVALVGAGFVHCDDTGGGAWCSRDGQVQGPRDVALVWRQPGRTDVALGDGRLDGDGTFRVEATVPDDAVPGTASVVLVRDGTPAQTADVEVTPG